MPASLARIPDATYGVADFGSYLECSGETMSLFRGIFDSVGALVLLFLVFLIATFPVTWLLMLFLGNVGAHISYWGTLPLGTVVSLIIGAGSSGGYRH
jgi:hypothetical protein